jgi:hypothetical protein
MNSYNKGTKNKTNYYLLPLTQEMIWVRSYCVAEKELVRWQVVHSCGKRDS